MAKLQTTNEPLASGIPPTWRQAYQKLAERINLIMGYSDDSDEAIPENVYPVADGAGGLLEGNIRIKTGSVDAESVFIGGIPTIATGGKYTNCMVTDLNLRAKTVSGADNATFGIGAHKIGAAIANVFMGKNAGGKLLETIAVWGNVFIGADAGNQIGQKDDAAYSIGIGVYAKTTKDRQVAIGSSDSLASPLETITRGVHINTRSKTAKNTTATLSAAECLAGVITSTSAAAVSLTLPSAADLIAVLNGGAQGTTFDLIIDNSAGANSVTIVASASITAITSPFTVTNPLIVTTGQKVGCFRFYFTSDTTAIVARVW